MIIIIAGIALVGVVNILKFNATDNKDEYDKTSVMGVVLLIFYAICAGIRYPIEERLMTKYDLDPLYLVGVEGVWGIIICLFMFITNFI